MAESFNKKEKQKQKQKKKQEKELRKGERRANSAGGKLEDMLAYVDEYGNITSTPPDPTRKREEVNLEDIEVSVPKLVRGEEDPVRMGTVTFFNESKGYGFIVDRESGQSIFVHANGLIDPIRENDKVTFETEMGQKGLNAVRVKLAKPA
jgi:cold shock CspA family protein